jgi:kinetochore protein Mis13/DSN1
MFFFLAPALPHREVRTADFYKHIADEGLSEPRRMRQLLIWCATRALGDKPSSFHQEDQSAHLAGKFVYYGDLKIG